MELLIAAGIGLAVGWMIGSSRRGTMHIEQGGQGGQSRQGGQDRLRPIRVKPPRRNPEWEDQGITSNQIGYIERLCRLVDTRLPPDLPKWKRDQAGEFIDRLKKLEARER